MIPVKFCEKLKVISSNFSVLKSNVAPLSSSSLSTKLVFVLSQGFLVQFVFFILLEVIYNDLKSNHNPINYQLCNHYFY